MPAADNKDRGSGADILRRAVADALGIEADDVTGGRLAEVMALDLREPLVDLSPLSALSNLEELNLDGQEISDLSPLSELGKLKVLNLNLTRIADLSPLSGLDNLEYLYLDETRITDLSALSELGNLEELHVSDTQITDLSPLRALPELRKLDLYRTNVSENDAGKLRDALPDIVINLSKPSP